MDFPPISNSVQLQPGSSAVCKVCPINACNWGCWNPEWPRTGLLLGHIESESIKADPTRGHRCIGSTEAVVLKTRICFFQYAKCVGRAFERETTVECEFGSNFVSRFVFIIMFFFLSIQSVWIYKNMDLYTE